MQFITNQKFLMSVNDSPAILGPEMAAPISWVPGTFGLLQENLHAHKIPPFRGGGVFWVLGFGQEVPIIFYGRGDFSEQRESQRHSVT